LRQQVRRLVMLFPFLFFFGQIIVDRIKNDTPPPPPQFQSKKGSFWSIVAFFSHGLMTYLGTHTAPLSSSRHSELNRPSHSSTPFSQLYTLLIALHPSYSSTPFLQLYTLLTALHPSYSSTPFSQLYTLLTALHIFRKALNHSSSCRGWTRGLDQRRMLLHLLLCT
jgi:hypothetical protein